MSRHSFPFLLIVQILAIVYGSVLSAEEPAKKPAAIEKARYPASLTAEGITFPKILDEGMKKVFSAPHTIFYKLPRIYQQYNPPTKIEHKSVETGRVTETITKGEYGIYYSTYEPDFNGNHAFPWEGTFGLNHAIKEGQLEKRYGSINMISLPLDKKGAVTPVLILNETPIKWIFPVGTVLGEILWVRDEKGKKWVYEIRCREKTAGGITWEPTILRPIKSRKDLLVYLNYPLDWRPPMTHLFLRNTHEDEVAKFSGFVERVPKLSADQVRYFLSLPFSNVTYDDWSELSPTPTSDQDFSLVPKDYSLGLVAANEVACATCHRQTQTSLWNLIPKEPLIYENPNKVANIRGSDGIFSWHPFADSSIGDGVTKPVKTEAREYDLKNLTIKIIRSGIDPVDIETYRLTQYVQQALKPYELPRDKRLLH